MRACLFLIGLMFAAGFSQAQRSYEAFDVLNGKTIVPPNGIRINDTLFLDDAEVMNSHYLEYLHFLVQDSLPINLIKAYPDTLIFGNRHLNKLLGNTKEYYKTQGGEHLPITALAYDSIIHYPAHHHQWWNYFSYHGTKHFPVVGISYEQAENYCRWRSDFVTRHFNEVLKKKKKYKAFKRMDVQFVFSLPEESLWEKAALGGLSSTEFPYGKNELLNRDSVLSFNVLDKLGSREPEFIYSNGPNSWGFFNMVGNVAEMTQQKGHCKGGSYLLDLQHCKIDSEKEYTKPEKWLGFRCVCTVRIKPYHQ